MKARKKVTFLLMLGALLLVAGLAMVPAMQASTCYGVLYEYYETSAMQEIVGAKVSCPGYPDQIDTAADGSYTETPYYTTQTVVCPCPSGGGGGGGGGGGEDTEDSP
jgi:hypothetical protein